MKNPQEILEILKAQFPNLEFQLDASLPVETFIIADAMAINKISNFLAENEELLFDSLMNLSGVDDANGTKVKDEEGNETINGGTLSVYYHLYSTKIGHKITVRVSTARENPEVESVENVWKTANWHEREAFDMFGIKFLNHSDLRRILMPIDWEAGYPLRKDYKNPEFYQGMKVTY